MDTWLEELLGFLEAMYEEIVKKTGVRPGLSALLPGLFTLIQTFLFGWAFVDRIAGDVLTEGLIELISVALTFVAVFLIVKWYINRLRYVFDDVCESKLNLLKFDVAVFLVELIYFVSMLEISSLCAPYDVWCVIIATPLMLYVLHKLFTAWLKKSFDSLRK